MTKEAEKKKKKVAWGDRSVTYRVGYIVCAVALVLAHVELLSGGSVCRYLFAKVFNSVILLHMLVLYPHLILMSVLTRVFRAAAQRWSCRWNHVWSKHRACV